MTTKMKLTTKRSVVMLMLAVGIALPTLTSAQEKVNPKSTETKRYTAQEAMDDLRNKQYEEAYKKIMTVTEADSYFSMTDIVYIKTEALLHIDEKKAIELAKKTLADTDNDERFMSNLANAITQTKGLSKETYLYGTEILKKITADMPEFSEFYVVYDYTGRCLYYAGDVAQAIAYAEKSIADAKKNNVPQETMSYLEGVLTQYKTPKS